MRKILCFVLILLLVPMGLMASFGVQATGESSAKTPVKKAKAAANTPTDDATIQNTLKEKFAKAPSMKDATVEIAVNEGVVTLTGKVPTGRQKGTATRMAKAVAGVKRVENKLEATNPSPVIPARAKEKK